VIRFGTSQVGAHAARRLADRGATVVAVQPNAAGRTLLCQLISHCDVMITDKEVDNGLEYEELGRQRLDVAMHSLAGSDPLVAQAAIMEAVDGVLAATLVLAALR
jgi:NAD(P)-dependent dehydrogenase (short-subunit alcohol dehydrogenase family)